MGRAKYSEALYCRPRVSIQTVTKEGRERDVLPQPVRLYHLTSSGSTD